MCKERWKSIHWFYWLIVGLPLKAFLWISGHIAGFHVTLWQPGWMARTKAFLSTGNLTLFHVNFSRKILCYYHSTWPPCHVVANEESIKDTKCPHCNNCLHSNKRPCSIILILERGRARFIFLLLLIKEQLCHIRNIVVLFMFPTLIDNIYGIFVAVTVSGQ